MKSFRELFEEKKVVSPTKDSIEDILITICKGKKVEYDKFRPMNDKELETEIRKILKESKGIEFKLLVGKVMGTLKGKAEGKKIIELLKRLTD